ncbi:MAG: hypothetical protein M3O50_22775 [Myxococcota bacterium]|nr:hypothetical protein [Myxococcota bacterium]
MSRGRELVLLGCVSAVWGLAVAMGGYALLRIVQSIVYPDPNPAALVWSAHSGYLWRIGTMAYAAGIAGFVAFLLARRRLDGAARALLPALATAAAMLVLQALLVP